MDNKHLLNIIDSYVNTSSLQKSIHKELLRKYIYILVYVRPNNLPERIKNDVDLMDPLSSTYVYTRCNYSKYYYYKRQWRNIIDGTISFKESSIYSAVPKN
jgi:hypothetical protein